jgi:hypothetical protein
MSSIRDTSIDVWSFGNVHGPALYRWRRYGAAVPGGVVVTKEFRRETDIEIVFISWTGQHENAARIENIFSNINIKVKVIYSDSDEFLVPNASWIRVPNDHFFSQKFEYAIQNFQKEVLLFITADATSSDWPELLRFCKSRFHQRADLTVWSPSVDYSPFSVDNVLIQKLDKHLARVIQTDSIVWAIDRRVINRMLDVDFKKNKLGWGIDSMAALFSHSMSYLVAMDTSVTVSHPRGSGYDRAEAYIQLKSFFNQLTPAEKYKKFQFFRFYGTL